MYGETISVRTRNKMALNWHRGLPETAGYTVKRKYTTRGEWKDDSCESREENCHAIDYLDNLYMVIPSGWLEH